MGAMLRAMGGYLHAHATVQKSNKLTLKTASLSAWFQREEPVAAVSPVFIEFCMVSRLSPPISQSGGAMMLRLPTRQMSTTL